MDLLALCLASIFLAVRGLVVLRRGCIYSVLLLMLFFYSLLFIFSYEELNKLNPSATHLAIWVYAIGTFIMLGAFFVLENFFSSVLNGSGKIWSCRLENYSRPHSIYCLFFMFGSLAFFVLFSSDLNNSWEEARSVNDFRNALPTYLFFLGVAGLFSAYRFSSIVFILLLVAAFIGFQFSGSRAAMLTLPAVCAWYWVTKKIDFFTFRSFFQAIAISIFVLLIHSILRGLRGFSPLEILNMFNSGDIKELLSAIQTSIETDPRGGESDILDYLVFSVSVAGENTYGYLVSVLRMLAIYIPGHFFAEKPIDVTYRLWSDAFTHGMFDHSAYYQALASQYAEGVMGSLHPTFFGEMFLSGQWIGLFVGVVFFAGLCIATEILLLKLPPIPALLLLGPSIVGMMMIARGNSVIGFGYIYHLLPIVLFSVYGVGFCVNTLKKGLSR